MTVVLINPPHSFAATHRGDKKRKEILAYPPLGLLYLATVLAKNNIDVRVIDSPTKGLNILEVISIVESEHPQVVGITSTTPQTRIAVQLAKALKQRLPQTPLGLGGAHISADPSFIERFPYFDFGVIGEGEITFLSLVKHIIEGNKVRGIYQGEIPTNLDDIPIPSRYLLNGGRYFMPIHSKKFTSILTSRGCPYDCLYCSRPVVGKHVRYRSAENVIQEIKQCIDRHEIEWFQFVDDTMTLNRENTVNICRELIDKQLNISWGCQTRVDLVDLELLKLMYKAGCREISFGVETGSERVRKMIHKNFSDETVKKAFQWCRDTGVDTTAFFIIGLPTETEEEREQTIKMSQKLPASYAEFHVTTPFPGSDLLPFAPQGIWDRYVKDNSLALPILGPSTILYTQKRAYRKFYLRPLYILQRLQRSLRSPRRLLKEIKVGVTILK
jgi:anaerobic magnesium-protoporphyrin IX monomethyl ester cyclase